MSIEEKIKTAKEDSWLKDSVSEEEFKQIKEDVKDCIFRKAVLEMLDKINKAVEDGEGFQYEEWVDYVEELPTYSAKLVKESGVLVKDLVKEDLISRQAVLDFTTEWCNRCGKRKEYDGVLCKCCDLADTIDFVEELPTIPQTDYESHEAFGWCKGCKEYDTEKHCCHRYSSFIRESLQENINAVLEDIKAELQTLADDEWNQKVMADKGLELAIEIIENYISRKE